jgi:hypothetical protein
VFSLTIVFVLLEGSRAFVDFVEATIIIGASINDIYSAEIEGKRSRPVHQTWRKGMPKFFKCLTAVALRKFLIPYKQQIAEIVQVAANPREER